MANQTNPAMDAKQRLIYQIRLEGQLGSQWTEWFGEVSIEPGNGETLLSCQVADQAALFGLLKKVRDLGMPLISVVRVMPDRPDAPDCSP